MSGRLLCIQTACWEIRLNYLRPWKGTNKTRTIQHIGWQRAYGDLQTRHSKAKREAPNLDTSRSNRRPRQFKWQYEPVLISHELVWPYPTASPNLTYHSGVRGRCHWDRRQLFQHARSSRHQKRGVVCPADKWTYAPNCLRLWQGSSPSKPRPHYENPLRSESDLYGWGLSRGVVWCRLFLRQVQLAKPRPPTLALLNRLVPVRRRRWPHLQNTHGSNNAGAIRRSDNGHPHRNQTKW